VCRQQDELCAVAHTGKLLYCPLGLKGQAGQLPDHQFHHVVGVSLGVNAIQVPRPSHVGMIEDQQSLVGERREELNGEKRIAGRLLVDQ
jgi:hypothetical protein